MSRSLGRWQALLLGIVILSGIGLGVAGLFAVGDRSWLGAEPFEVRVAFDSIRGVETGTRVRILGMDAGDVAEIEPPAVASEPVQLRLRLRRDYRHLVLTGSTVQIVNEGLIGAKVLEIRSGGIAPGSPEAVPVADGAMLRSRPSIELTDVLTEVDHTLQALRAGDGTVAKLVNDPKAYQALVTLLEQSKDTMNAFHENAEAIKRLPVVRGYVEDPVALLVRPQCERNRRVFAEQELFEPSRAVLTGTGRQRLDELAPWLEASKQAGSEVVVAAYADRGKTAAPLARELTRQQSGAVVDYLRQQLSAHKLGWFRSRKITALGQGVTPPPEAEPTPLPAARVEVIVFVPQ